MFLRNTCYLHIVARFFMTTQQTSFSCVFEIFSFVVVVFPTLNFVRLISALPLQLMKLTEGRRGTFTPFWCFRVFFFFFLACLPLFLRWQSVTSWRLSRVCGHSRSLGCLLLIQLALVCSPTQFAIKTKFRALKPEGRWVSAQGTCCLATQGGGGREGVPER